MKINFTKKEKKQIIDIISSYEEVNKKMDELKKESERIEKDVNDCTNRLNELHDDEVNLIKKLREKYGQFSLQDISDTIYG